MINGVLYLLKLCWKCKKSSIIYLLLESICKAFLPLLLIVFPKILLDELFGEQRIDFLIVYVIILIAVTVFGNQLADFFHTRYFIKKMEVSNKFYLMVDEKLMNVELRCMEEPDFLDLRYKAERFMNADGYGFGGILDKTANLISHIIVLCGIVGVIVSLSPIIILVFVSMIGLNAWIDAKVKKMNIKLDLERPKYERKLAYEESICGEYRFAKEVRIYGLKHWVLEQIGIQNKVLEDFYVRINNNTLKTKTVANIASGIQLIITYLYLIYGVINKVFGIGSFTMYLNAINSFTSSVTSITETIMEIRNYSQYYTYLKKYLSLPEMEENGERIEIAPFEIEFVNVSFCYPGQEKQVIKNLSIKIKKGEKIAVVGENGAGKTTFIKLLLGFYEPTEGKILLNGRNIRDISYESYCQLFSVVFQDYILFAKTVKENVALHKTDQMKDEQIIENLQTSGFAERLATLSNGIHTQVYKEFDESGFEPSGGEGQKIALARAITKQAPFVILDEPTAALDPKAEYEMYQRFHEISKGRSAIFVSHRLASTKFCDKVFVFDNGTLVEVGKHEELMEKKGKYSELFTLQSQYYL